MKTTNNTTKKILFALSLLIGALLLGWLASNQMSPKYRSSEPAQISQDDHSADSVDSVDSVDDHHGAAPSAEPAASSTALSNTAPSNKFNQFEVGNRNVKSIFPDGDTVWIGTSGGAVRYDTVHDDYQLYSVRNGLLANGVFHVTRVADRIAVGTYGGGLALFDQPNDDWQIYNVPEGLGDAFVYWTLQTKAGDLWIATWTGANLIKNADIDNPDAWEIHTVKSTSNGEPNVGLPNDWVYGLAEGKNGEMWFATEGGLARYDHGEWRHWKHDDGLGADYDQVKAQNVFMTDPADVSSHHAKQKVEMGLQDVNTAYNPNYIVAIAVDHEGAVWAGTWGGGLSRFDGESWTTLTMSDGLPSNHIFSLYSDSKQNIWIGTSHGLVRKSPDGTMKTFTRNDGLYSDAVFSLAEDQNGTLWVGSYGGVARLNLQ